MIKNFSQYLLEEDRQVYFTFGRMNPPTIGHGKLLDVLAKKAQKSDYKVYLSQSQSAKKDPLKYTTKIKYARKMFPKHARNIIIDNEVKTVFDVLVKLYNEGYSRVTMVVGSDRVREFDTLIRKYNGQEARHGMYEFTTINVVSAGERDPDSEGVEGMSASKQRQNAADNDFMSFSQGVSKSMSNADTRKLFNDVRAGMGMSQVKEFKNHIELPTVSETREKFVQGELFDIGDRVVVKESGDITEVTFLGANYVITETDGVKTRRWLDAVELLEERGPCWKGYKQVGMKKKNGKEVPNCVPEKKVKSFKQMVDEEGGAGDEGTDKLVKRYKKDTPMQESADIVEATLGQDIAKLLAKTIKKSEYARIANYIKKQKQDGKLKSGHSDVYHAQDIIRKFNIKGVNARVLADMI